MHGCYLEGDQGKSRRRAEHSRPHKHSQLHTFHYQEITLGVGGNSIKAVTVLANVISILYGMRGCENKIFFLGRKTAAALEPVNGVSFLFGLSCEMSSAPRLQCALSDKHFMGVVCPQGKVINNPCQEHDGIV